MCILQKDFVSQLPFLQACNLSVCFYFTDTDTDTDNFVIVSSGVYIVKYIFKSWNNQQLKLSYKRPTFTL